MILIKYQNIYFLSNTLINIHKINSYNFSTKINNKLKKYLSSKKKENVLKIYNQENKLLFGKLLETQTQRKKRLIERGIIINNEENHFSVPKEIIIEEEDDHCVKIDVNIQPSLSEILRNDFPFENPNKPLLSLNTTDFISPQKEKHQDEGYFPAVTSILTATMSPMAKKALERWRQNKIASLGMDGFLALNKATLQKGREFHLAISQALGEKQNEMKFSLEIENCLKSAENILNQISKVHILEGLVVHKTLKYKGYVDCICDIGGIQNVAIEWKKSENKKSKLEQTYDAPLQLVAYMGAANYDDVYTSQVTTGIVVVVNEDGSPASVFYIKDNMAKDYWMNWYRRYQMFNQEENKIEKN